MKKTDICLLSPWYGGSHKRWADALKAVSSHSIDIFSLPDRHWKWRMHGAAVTLAEQVLSSGKQYDLFLADDMMDVAVFSSLIRGRGLNAPIYTYFHENQICYPVSPLDTDPAQGRDLHYGYVNFTTALASDKLLFNSHYHKEAFLGALPGFLSRFPDYNQKGLVSGIADKSEVLQLGMNLSLLDSAKPDIRTENKRPLILWNHRWEYDKCPGEFLRLLLDLHKQGADFEIALLGERGSDLPIELEEVKQVMSDRIVWNGEVDDFTQYAAWLWKADIVPVTAIHDFFGGSVVEALYCQCHVILPDRLAYPEHVTDRKYLYKDYPELVDLSLDLVSSGNWKLKESANSKVSQYDWRKIIRLYDSKFSGIK